MSSKSVQPFPFFATLCMLIGVAILLSLGTWQVKRLEWKQNIIQKIDAVKDIDARQNALTIRDLQNVSDDPYAYLRGTLQGELLPPDKTIFIEPRTNDKGEVGAYLVQGLVLQSGDVAVINFGWVPDQSNTYLSEDFESPETKITGYLKPFPDKNAFTPDNRIKSGQWTFIDREDIKQYWNAKSLAPLVTYAESTHLQDTYPTGFSKNWEPYNKHFQYAVFWYAMACVLFIIYVLRFIVPYLRSRT